MTVSRRNVLPVLTVAASVPLLLSLTAARAEAEWSEYRRDDLFSVELPGEPDMTAEFTSIQVFKGGFGPGLLGDLNEKKDLLVRVSMVEAHREQIRVGVYSVEYKKPVSPEEEFATLRETLRKGGFAPPREAALTVNGFPAREFACEADDN